MRSIKPLIYILTGLLIVSSCKKNNNVDTVSDIVYNDAETVTASVAGIVVNENNIPIAGATVKLGSQTVITNAYGLFRFQNIAISKNNGYVKITKAGYFNGNRNFLTTAGRTHNLRIKLLPKTITGTISGGSGGSISLSSGAKVTFQANTITDASGNTYSGTVNVAMVWLSPVANDLGSTIQGDLRGITASGNERVLEMYGMLGVELTNTSGQELKIAGGKTAEISLPIPASLQATAPATIALWHFDEVKGRWMEQGIAAKTGTSYIGNVTHFSFWDLSPALPKINLCINVVNQNNQPLIYAGIVLHRVNFPASVGYSYLDSLGNTCGEVPKIEPLTLDVLDWCGSIIYSQNIGPYTNDASVNIIANIVAVTLTGKILNCNNAPVTNGTAIIYTSGGYFYNVPTNNNGIFNAVILNCSNINYSILPVDNVTQQQGMQVTGTATGGIVNIGNLQACGATTLQYIHAWIDGVPYSWTAPADTLVGELLGFAPGGPYANGAVTRGYRPQSTNNGGGVDGYRTDFYYNTATGSYPISAVVIYLPSALLFSTQITSANPQVNLTVIGSPVTGFLEGNYNINMSFQPGNVIKSVQCDFRVRRPQ